MIETKYEISKQILMLLSGEGELKHILETFTLT